MPDPVRFDLDGGTARIVIDNPPVNVTSQAVRAGLMTALDTAEATGAERVVLTGAGRAFVAGADAKEFAAPPQPPHLPDLVARIESFPAPVVAAINGAALGGGYEITLACNHRILVDDPKVEVGLPEASLGLLPGGGGVTRVVRLLGIQDGLMKDRMATIIHPRAVTHQRCDGLSADAKQPARTIAPA